MQEIGFICLMPEEVNEYCQELRLKIAQEFGLNADSKIPAHMTMKYRFPTVSLAEIDRVAREFSRSQTKTRLCLRGFNRFINPGHYVIFIDVLASPEMRRAHAAFLNRLREIHGVQWGPFDHAELHYHVTLAAQGLTAASFESAWWFVNRHKQPSFEVFFDNLTMIQLDEDCRSIYKTYWFAT